MNERINKLKEQAKEKVISHGAYGETEIYWETNVDKFAELIVRECANALTIRASHYTSCSSDDPTTAEWFSGTVNGLKEGADLIKKHFGVEE